MIPAYINVIQQILNTLISEEMLAFETYKLMRYNIPVTQRQKIFTHIIDDLEIISTDEYDDHAKKLIAFCEKFGFSYPKTNQEFKKFASESALTAFETGTSFYALDALIDAVYLLELDAIASYGKALAKLDETLNPNLSAGNFELISEFLKILENNLKDEREHAEMMVVLKQTLV